MWKSQSEEIYLLSRYSSGQMLRWQGVKNMDKEKEMIVTAQAVLSERRMVRKESGQCVNRKAFPLLKGSRTISEPGQWRRPSKRRLDERAFNNRHTITDTVVERAGQRKSREDQGWAQTRGKWAKKWFAAVPRERFALSKRCFLRFWPMKL